MTEGKGKKKDVTPPDFVPDQGGNEIRGKRKKKEKVGEGRRRRREGSGQSLDTSTGEK